MALFSLPSSCRKNQSLQNGEYRVQASLEQFDLEDLISDLPRPNENAPSYAKWRKDSKMVRMWFISAIHDDLLDDIMDCGERLMQMNFSEN